MKTALRPLLLLLAFAFAAVAHADLEESPEGAELVVIPEVTDLQAEATVARQRQLPILLMFSANGCRYCTLMERDFLKPMSYSGDYSDKVLFRKIKLVAGASVRDFDGRTIAVEDLRLRYGVKVTPTLVFLDDQGRQTAEKMVGLTTPDFFGGYLDSAIQTAHRNVRQGHALACGKGDHPGAC